MKNEVFDEDWTLPKFISCIRKSHLFYELSKKKQKEYTAEAIETFLRKNKYYKDSIYNNTHNHALMMREWRLKPQEEEDD